MKMSMKPILRPTLRGLVSALAVTALSSFVARAVPYASGISNDAGNVSFYLNEAADDVTIIFDGGGVGNTNSLGAQAKGLRSFSLGGHASWEIHVTKSTAVAWTQTSDDLNPLVRFFGGRGIAVNTSASDLSRFGRIYVLDSVGGLTSLPPTESNRTTQKGFYVLNADQSDTFGYGATAQTAGLGFAASANSPIRIELGEDGMLYIADYSSANATIFRADADLTTGEQVLDGIGMAANTAVHTDIQGSAIAKGSIAGGDLVLWAIDGSWPSGGFNRLLRWDVGAGPLPYAGAPTALRTAGNSAAADVWTDLDIAPDGKIFMCQFRDWGAPQYVYNTDRVNIRVLDTDGLTVLWDSFLQSQLAGLTNATSGDVFRLARAIKVSPDGKRVAVIRNDTQTWIMSLTNGIPDISTRLLLNTFGATTTVSSNGREVSWDAAGNLYAANVTQEKMRVWSPGGTTTAITRSSGTFEVIVPATTVTASAPTPTANEQAPVNGVIRLTRTGDTSGLLTVNYAVTGTATSGSDYTALPGSVTFAAGATTTNITVVPIDDTSAELTETVILTLTSGTGYGLGSPSSATVSILDNESPEISFVSAAPKKLLEGYAPSKVTHQVVRRGLLTSALTVNVTYSGTATRTSDFAGATTVALAANAVNANLVLTPINDQAYEGDEIATANVAAGTGYTIGTASSISATVVDDDPPPGVVLFGDNFDTDSSALWKVNLADPANGSVSFAWDYSAVGIPAAPGGGGTKGMRMQCGNIIVSQDAVSASPLGGNFTGDYRLKFDMWINYNGPMPDGGTGSTQNFDAGVGTSGEGVVWLYSYQPPADGVWFSATGDGADGNAGGDYNAVIGDVIQNDDTGFYAAGTGTPDSGVRNGSHSFYSLWGGQAAPAAQLALYPNQTGVANIGNAGMAWHTVVITKAGDVVTWAIDGITIATVTNTTMPWSTNVFVGYQDLFASGNPSDVPAMSFGLVDNLKVLSLVAPAGAATITSIVPGAGSYSINYTGGSGSQFVLLKSSTANAPLASWTRAATNASGSGVFSVAAEAPKFYRIKSE